MKRILVVDDEEGIRHLYQEEFEEEGYEVELAEKGEEALKKISKAKPDVVILDLKMPGMGGLEVLKKVKRLDIDIEVIILTGNATFENAVQAMKEDGAYNYLTKPLDNIEDLLI